MGSLNESPGKLLARPGSLNFWKRLGLEVRSKRGMIEYLCPLR